MEVSAGWVFGYRACNWAGKGGKESYTGRRWEEDGRLSK